MLDERDLGPDAARSLAVFDDPQLPSFLLASFARLKEPTRDAVVVTLCARPASARVLLAAVAAGAIDRARVPAFQVRQMAGFSDALVHRQVLKLWPELKTMSAAKRQRINQLKSQLRPAALAEADPVQGRRRFVQTCATCHTLFGQGGKLGPDLTGSQRANLDYLLENIIDPSAIVAPAYKMSTIALVDGRVLSGIVVDQPGPTLAVQTPTERMIVNRSDVEQIRKSDLSLMPDGLLEVLPEKEIRDLLAYLMSPQQVSLPVNQPGGESSRSQMSPSMR
jgi:putative heme-binding domain-containing protein